jgi:hypothetical protein
MKENVNLPIISLGQTISLTATICILLFVLIPCGILLLFQLSYLINNQTTIESWEIERVNTLVRQKLLEKTRFPYDISIFANIRAVLGGFPYLWPKDMTGTGMEFETKRGTRGNFVLGSTSRDDEVWPPEEYESHYHGKGKADDDDDGIDDYNRPRIRRGSEGYEVMPITAEQREEMVNMEY